MMTTPDPYPEHTKQSLVLEEAQAIGQFLDEGPYIMAEYVTVDGFSEPRLLPLTKTTQQVLADYFSIDLRKIENEKRAMLAALSNDAPQPEDAGPRA